MPYAVAFPDVDRFSMNIGADTVAEVWFVQLRSAAGASAVVSTASAAAWSSSASAASWAYSAAPDKSTATQTLIQVNLRIVPPLNSKNNPVYLFKYIIRNSTYTSHTAHCTWRYRRKTRCAQD